MITDSIIESLVNCKYEVYLKVNKEESTKKEYELMQDDLLKLYKERFINSVKLRYGDNHLLYDFKFGNNLRFRNRSFAVSPNIKTKKCHITFDFIEIIPSKFSNGGRIFIPILVSPKENFSKIEKLILCLKCIILSEVYNINCKFARIVYGNELKTIKFKIEKFLMEAKRLLDKLKDIIENESEPLILQKNHCKICEFQEECYKKLKEKDSLALFRRVDENEIKKYNDKGIFTVNQLSYSFKPRKRSKRVKDVISPYYLSLQALALRENKIYVHDKIYLPESKTKVYIDMEGNSTGSSIYLIGIIINKEGKEITHSLWADNNDQEIEIFRKFVDILKNLDKPNIYHYGRYETKVLRRIASLFDEGSIKELFQKKSTNILKEIYRKIYFPTYSNSLKEVGQFFGVTWSGISSAVESVVLRNKWERNKDIKIKETLITYNKQDCIALKEITEFLYGLFGKLTKKETKAQEKVNFVDNMQSADDEKKRFENMEYTSKDIEVITKCAYFEYQRNRIYLKSSKRLRKIAKRSRKQNNLRIRINKKFHITEDRCEYCKNTKIKIKDKDLYNTIIFDLKFFNFGIKRWVTNYTTYPYFCRNCKRYFVPKKYGAILYYSKRTNVVKSYITRIQWGWGQNLIAYVINQVLTNRIPLRSLSSNLKHHFHIPIESYRVYDLKVMASKYYKSTYELILKKIINGNLIHADESKIKLRNNSGYIWVFTNMEEVYYMYKPNRESDFIGEFMKGFTGVLITDFYTGYDSIDCQKQKCLIHLIRDLNDTLLKSLHDQEVKEIVNNFGKLTRQIVETINKFGLKKRFLGKHKKQVNSYFKKLRKRKYGSEVAEKIQKRIIKHKEELFTFLSYDTIPWNNNNVEYAIKICKDHFRSTKGQSTVESAETYLILLSVYQTCKYKGINFFDFLISGKKDIDEFEASLKK
jgi:predicted RecB family nuclease